MKKIFFAVALCATLVSCGGDKSYFAKVENRMTNNPEAEFDTLSYALGMSSSVGFKTNMKELNVDFDLYADTFLATIEKGFSSYEAFEARQKAFADVQREKLSPFMMALRMRQMGNANQELPNPYDETFTAADFTKTLATLNATDMITHGVPINAHYVAMAIRDVKNIEADSLVDAAVRIPEERARAAVRGYNKQIEENITPMAKAWLNDIATKPGVEQLVVAGDTLYYRINNEGGVKPMPTDSVALYFDVYTFRGRKIGSSDNGIIRLKENIESIKKDEKLSDSLRNVRIAQCQKQIDIMKAQKTPMGRIFVPALKHCLPLVGEFGSITIWAPGKLAGGSRALLPGEAVVINAEIKKISKGTPIPASVVPTKNNGGTPLKLVPQGPGQDGAKKGGVPKVAPGKPANPKDVAPQKNVIKVNTEKPTTKK